MGDWVNGKKTGEGVMTWPDGAKYLGQFKDDLQNGRAIYYFPNGIKYVGDWVNGTSTGGTKYVSQSKDKVLGVKTSLEQSLIV